MCLVGRIGIHGWLVFYVSLHHVHGKAFVRQMTRCCRGKLLSHVDGMLHRPIIAKNKRNELLGYFLMVYRISGQVMWVPTHISRLKMNSSQAGLVA
jgi:hypothetical protein